MSLRACIFYEQYGGALQQWRSQLRARDVDSTKVDGFFAFKRDIADQLDLVVDHVSADLARLDLEIEKHGADLVIVIPKWSNWHASPAPLIDSFARVHSKTDRPALAVFDVSDPTSSPFLDLLPHVDIFLKSQLLADRARYADEIAGGFVLAEWVQNELGFALGDWHFGTKGDSAYLDRMMCGWTMGMSRFYRRLIGVSDRFAKPLGQRDFDLHRRFQKPDPATSPSWEWYQAYRRFAATQVDGCVDFTMTTSSPLPQLTYLRDMMNCRAVFSPFGWGEICFRDYEAIACGAVLLKPDMAYLESRPDFFEAGETYVPVAWDLSDLQEKMEWLRDEPAEAERIVRSARQRLSANSIRDGFIADLKEILSRTGLA